MTGLLNSIFAILQVTLIDIVLSGDNMGVIALAIRNLPPKIAKRANFVGVVGAILLRIVFASVITTLLMIEWLPIKILGGLMLLRVTWSLIRMKDNENVYRVKEKRSFWVAVYNIIVADLSMSLDNVLAIGGIAHGNIVIIVFGLLFNIPVIFFGSQLVVRLIKRNKITIYIGAGILVHTALDMIFEDKFAAPYINGVFSKVFPWIVAVIIMIYGFFSLKRKAVKKRL
jgi:YjbE family integral membrane protein